MRQKLAFLRAVPVRTPGHIELEIWKSKEPHIPPSGAMKSTFYSRKKCCAQDIVDNFKQRAVRNTSVPCWAVYHPKGDPTHQLLYEVRVAVHFQKC
jgi:hypothetical protein